MLLILTCTCGNRLKVPKDAIGRAGRCPKCGEVTRITQENTSELKGNSPDVSETDAAKPTKRIGELMVEAGVITEGELRDALHIQEKRGGKVVEQLISLGHLDPDAFVSFLGSQPGVASLELSGYRIAPDIVNLIPKEMAIQHEIFPIDRLGKLLTLGMVCPLDAETIRTIEESTGLRVKPILCAPGDIRRALDEHFGDEWREIKSRTQARPGAVASEMKLQRVSTLLKKMETLPVLPETVHRVRAAMDDIRQGASDVAAIVLEDPPTAAKVLSVANSAAFGFPNQIDTVELAVSLLGLKETLSIVTSAAVMAMFEDGKHRDYRVFWDEALSAAGASRRIAKIAKIENPAGAFTGGLLHDIGRIALIETVPERYAAISNDLNDVDLVEAENEAFGMSHAEAGYELAKVWKLPDELCDCIRHHHAPELAEVAPKQVAAVALAEIWTRSHPVGQSSREEVLALTPEIFRILELNETTAAEAYDAVAELPVPRFQWSESA